MKQNYRIFVQLFSLVIIELLVISIAAAAPPATSGNTDFESSYQNSSIISKIETVQHQDGVEVLVQGNKILEYRTYNFENPARIAIDLKGFGLKNVPENMNVEMGSVASIKSREFANEKDILTRIEITLSEGSTDNVEISLKGKTLSVFIPGEFGRTARRAGLKANLSREPVQDVFSSIEASSPDVSIPEPKTMKPDDVPFVRLSQNLNMHQTAQAGTYIEKTIGTDDIHQGTLLAEYEGIPISLDLKDADIVDIFLTISELTGYNIIIDPKVKGKINIRMNDVPWDQALDIILKQMQLGKEYTGAKSPEFPGGNIIRIASVKALRREADERRKLLEAQKVAQPMITKIIYLSYADAKKMEKIVKKLLSKRGEIIVDKRTNSMLLTDIPANLDKIRRMITLLDVRTKQVLISAKIITTKKDFVRQLGISWGSTFTADAIHGNTTGYRFPNHYALDYAVSLPGGNPILGLALGNVMDTFQLNAILGASEREGLTKVISNPRIMTSDNVQAEIKSGTQLAYNVYTDRGIRIAFKDAVISLRVTPHVTHDNYIELNVEAKKDSPDYSIDPPAIFTNRAKTEVLVKDGDTFVIGGLNQTTTGWTDDRIPFLHRIPILGWLFKSKSIKNEYDDLLVFITPKIVQQEQTKLQTISFDQSILPSEEKKIQK